MAYPKVKEETFEGFGGINTKVSTYITGLHECLDLQNFDFSMPGSYTTRWGSTLYFSSTLPVTSDGAGHTFLSRVLGVYEYESLNGASQIIVTTPDSVYFANGLSLSLGYSFQSVISFQGIYNNPTDFVELNNFLFLAQNTVTLKYDGATFYSFGLPNTWHSGSPFSYGYTLAAGTSGTGYSGTISFKIGWTDITGYRGVPTDGVTITMNGVSYSQFSVYFDVAQAQTAQRIWGATALALYVQPPGAGTFFEVGAFASITPLGSTVIINSSGSSATSNPVNQSIYGYLPIQYPNVFRNGVDPNIFDVRYLEIYNNQMFFAGFTTSSFTPSIGQPYTTNYQSRLYWSEVGDPEFIDPTFFAEVRTNDGDRITGLKSYQDTLLIFKQRSFHVLNGNSATDLTIQQKSDQYGCISNRCAVVYNQQCLFLDRKGIMRWDGANISCASNKIESVFNRMNVVAALDNAVGFHIKRRNEVWFGIPVDGATLNNLTVVYDYVADAWTTFNGFKPSSVTVAKGRMTDYYPLYGSYTGSVHNFHPTLLSDGGSAIPTFMKSLFYRTMGNTVEKQWRRLFVDSDILAAGSTLQIDMIPDHGTSIYLTRSMAVGTFQNRIDFGIPAKSLQFQFTYASATLPIRINGITPESRYQRGV